MSTPWAGAKHSNVYTSRANANATRVPVPCASIAQPEWARMPVTVGLPANTPRHTITAMHTIREATAADWPAIWAMFREVTAAGDSFAYDEHTPEEVARKLWVEPPSVAFVAELDG